MENIKEISMAEFRRKISAIVYQVHYTEKPIILTMKGKPMVKLESVRDQQGSEKA